MERQSMVHRVAVTHAGQTYKADYFVQDGVIHANLEGRVLRRPLSDAEPAETVRAMLAGHLVHRNRKFSMLADWTKLKRQ